MKYQSCHLFDLLSKYEQHDHKIQQVLKLKIQLLPPTENLFHPFALQLSLLPSSAKEQLWVPSFGFPAQYSISPWSPSALHYSHNSDYLFFLLILKALLLATSCHECTKPDVGFSLWLRCGKDLPCY